LKKLLFIVFLISGYLSALAQTETTETVIRIDTGIIVKPKPVKQPATIDSQQKSAVADTLRKHVVIDTLKRKNVLRDTSAADSATITDSTAVDSINTIAADTAKIPVRPVVVKKPIDSFYLKLLDNPFLRTDKKPIFLVINERQRVSKDEKFYLLAGLLAFLAFIKLVFAKYFANIFRLFFQPSFRQKQTREQLLQSNLPSLLLNLFFIFSGGAYISFVLYYYQVADIGFWWLLLYSTSALLIIYVGKYIFLGFASWVFNIKEAIETYIFAVFLINKILGVILIPFTLIVAFSKPAIIDISITVSILLILLLFIYRYLVSYAPVRREVKVSVLHFFLYICAFELTPLLLIYKTLIFYLDRSL